MLTAFFQAAAPLALVLSGMVAAAAPIAKASGPAMCVLNQRDFAKFGTVVESTPRVNLDDGGKSAYCVYRGKSGAMGGVELDVFYPAGDTDDDIKQTFKTVLGSDPGASYIPEGIRSADESVYSLSVPQPGHFPFAANAVRRRDLVFSISLPSSPTAKSELQRLSEIVLTRL